MPNPKTAPSMPVTTLVDIHGKTISLKNGKRWVVSLFREATCPFCNFRIYELTHNYPEFRQSGLDFVVIFQSPPDDIARFIARQPRPFHMVADENGQLHHAFQVQSSRWGKWVAMMRRPWSLLRGMVMVGMRGVANGNLMPADFLVDETGHVIEAYYGKDAGDHIPLERVRRFASK